MQVLGSLVSLLELHTPGCNSAPERKTGSEGGKKLQGADRELSSPRTRDRGGGWHLFLADLLVALVLKPLFHCGQRDLSVILGDVIVEAANRGTHEG